MTTKKFTKEQANEVKQLPTMNEVITKVTLLTKPGIYTFRNCPNVAIWNISKVITGTKNPKTETLFNFCLRSFEVKENGNFFEDAFSRHLRKATDTMNKTSKGKPGPDTAQEREQYGAYASEEVIKANTEQKESKGKSKSKKA
jgi:hypothetical protein